MLTRNLVLFCLLAIAPPSAAGDAPPTVTPPGVEGIRTAELFGHLRFLASDEMAGRDTGTVHERLASEYLAGQLVRMGIAPSGDATGAELSYFAEFPLRRLQPDREGTRLALAFDDGEVARKIHLTATQDFVVSPRGLEPGTIEAPIVYVGGGTKDDYAAIDVQGKYALVAMAPVSGGRRGALSFSAVRALRKAAEAAGAVGLLVVRRKPTVDEGADAEQPTEEPKPFREALAWANRSFERSSLLLGEAPEQKDTEQNDSEKSDEGSRRIPVLYLESAAGEFLADTGLPSETTPRSLEHLTAAFTYAATHEKIRSRNVVGIIPGSDPARSDEVIVFSAHYDHVGVDPKGEVFNGADDNASGTSAILEVAEAFAEHDAPPRTVVFLWVSGEEKGLLGSEWWTEHPTLPKNATIVANINMDMVGRNDPGKVSVCPSADHDGYSTMGRLIDAACAAESFTAVYDADRYYRRTDSYNFAKKGIPSVFLFSGEHPDYHRITDTIDKIDSEKATSIARIAYRVGHAVAHATDRPRIVERETETEDDD